VFMNRITMITAVTSGALLLTSAAWASPTFLLDVPNALTNSCNTCHTTTNPAAWNSFGDDVKANLVEEVPDWASVCDIDSDGDGATNGQELGDPDCVWVKGDANPAGDVFHPGDAAVAPELEHEGTDEGTDEGDDEGTDEGDDDGTDEGDDDGTDEHEEGMDDDPSGHEEGMDDDADGTEPAADGGCQGGPAVPLSAFLTLMCAGILTRRRLA
jgi:hypothetical protein